METSLIVCSVDDSKFRAVSENISSRLRDTFHEIIRISDARSLAEGYNRGIEQSSGDRLIFCHDDVEILNDDFAQRLDETLSHSDIAGVVGADLVINGYWASAGPPHVGGHVICPNPDGGGFAISLYGPPTLPNPVQAMDGCFMAINRRVAEKIRFDGQTFDGFHLYDLDFTFSAFLAGFRLAIADDIDLVHASIGTFDETWRGYAQRFATKYRGKQRAHSPPRNFSPTTVSVSTKAEALEFMISYRAATKCS